MATPYICPSVRWGMGQQLWLPPWMRFRVSQRQEVTVRNPAGASRALITSVQLNQGTNLEAVIQDYPTASVAAVIAWNRAIWSSMAGKIFTLNYYATDAWQRCACVGFDYPVGEDPVTKAQYALRDMSFQVFSEYNEPSLSAGITFANLADYVATYPYASQVGRPVGDVADTSAAEFAPMVIPFDGWFEGEATVTTSGYERTYTVPGSASDTYRISNLKIISSNNFGATGNTVVTVSDAAVGGGGSTITRTLALGDKVTAKGTDFFDVAGGSTIYAFISTANGHQSVTFRFDCEAQ